MLAPFANSGQESAPPRSAALVLCRQPAPCDAISAARQLRMVSTLPPESHDGLASAKMNVSSMQANLPESQAGEPACPSATSEPPQPLLQIRQRFGDRAHRTCIDRAGVAVECYGVSLAQFRAA